VAIVLAGLLGLLLGGALNVVIQRLPGSRPLFRRPRCTRCGHDLSWEAVPLVGYLAQRGRCRHCGQPILKFFPLVELLTAAAFVVLAWRATAAWSWQGAPLPPWRAVLYAFFVLALVVTLFLDWLRHEIYYIILLPGTAVALLASLVPALGLDFRSSLVGLIVGLFFFGLLFVFGRLLFRIEALALGDVWLAGMIGAMTGFYGALQTLAGGIVLAAVGAGLLLLLRRVSAKDYMPYGSYLCLAALLYLCLMG
jgi:leader peptidase (prepilin peptidase)/N-methyltransferase